MLLAVLAGTGFDPFQTSRDIDPFSPDTFGPGELDVEAVEMVRTFDAFPVLWLGEEFAGYRLTSITHVDTETMGPPSGRSTSLSLVYGACERRNACFYPALVVRTWAPGSLPVPTDGSPPPPGMGMRGLGFAHLLAGPAVSASNGLVFEVQSVLGLEDDALWQLSLANAAAVGLPELGPDDDLSPIHDWRPR